MDREVRVGCWTGSAVDDRPSERSVLSLECLTALPPDAGIPLPECSFGSTHDGLFLLADACRGGSQVRTHLGQTP
ncbi:MAG: hypothetical protein OSB03_12955, partial [Vicinamibacterales bacterium]|nr:hypothetical protein [Vicinamibacterales bacterium]